VCVVCVYVCVLHTSSSPLCALSCNATPLRIFLIMSNQAAAVCTHTHIYTLTHTHTHTHTYTHTHTHTLTSTGSQHQTFTANVTTKGGTTTSSNHYPPRPPTITTTTTTTSMPNPLDKEAPSLSTMSAAPYTATHSHAHPLRSHSHTAMCTTHSLTAPPHTATHGHPAPHATTHGQAAPHTTTHGQAAPLSRPGSNQQEPFKTAASSFSSVAGAAHLNPQDGYSMYTDPAYSGYSELQSEGGGLGWCCNACVHACVCVCVPALCGAHGSVYVCVRRSVCRVWPSVYSVCVYVCVSVQSASIHQG